MNNYIDQDSFVLDTPSTKKKINNAAVMVEIETPA